MRSSAMDDFGQCERTCAAASIFAVGTISIKGPAEWFPHPKSEDEAAGYLRKSSRLAAPVTPTLMSTMLSVLAGIRMAAIIGLSEPCMANNRPTML